MLLEVGVGEVVVEVVVVVVEVGVVVMVGNPEKLGGTYIEKL
jgi:hypothetical protein